MAASTEVRSGLFYGWDFGEIGWHSEMDQNLLKLGRVMTHLTVLDRDLTSPPGSPSLGDTYIVAEEATGDWDSLDNAVVIWDGTSWIPYVPRTGYLAYIVDEEKLSVFKQASGWSAGISI